MLSARYTGAVPLRHRKTSDASLKVIRSGTRSQCIVLGAVESRGRILPGTEYYPSSGVEDGLQPTKLACRYSPASVALIAIVNTRQNKQCNERK